MNTPSSVKTSPWLAAILLVLFAISLSWFVAQNAGSGMTGLNLITSALLLAVPLALLYASVGVLALVWEQHRRGQITGGLAKALYWMPRITGLLITLFVGMFALDVFGAGYSFWESIGAFLIHAMPAIIMGIVLAFAWRKPVVGFLAFTLAAVFFLRVLLGNPEGGLGTLLLFSGPMALAAALFWVNWKWLGGKRPV